MAPADNGDRRPLVIGIGNRHRGDDGVGPMVIDGLEAGRFGWLTTATVEGDLSMLMDLWHRDQPVVVVDAVSSGLPPGTIVAIDLLARELEPGPSPQSSHGLGLSDAIGLAQLLDRLPRSLLLLGVQGGGFSVGDPVGPAVARSAAILIDHIPRLLQGVVDDGPVPDLPEGTMGPAPSP